MPTSSPTSRQKLEQRAAAIAEAKRRGLKLPTLSDALSQPIWKPQPGPQANAYNSDADIIGYGGAAGGGKTDLALGMAITKHHHTAIFRKYSPNVRSILERSREILARVRGASLNQGHPALWRLPGDSLIEFGSLPNEDDKFKQQGRPRDLYIFDEATELSESVIRFVTGWNRSTYIDPKTNKPIKCQQLFTFNPPITEDGDWIVRFFAPWLDPKHPNPAEDGELRYFAMIDGVECEVAGDWVGTDPATGKPIYPKSRTFFHASLKDNPILEQTGYGSVIDAMPEPLRSILKGNFTTQRTADPTQTIPTAWVLAAMERWRQVTKPTDVPLHALGVDVARGGKDQTISARRYGAWFDTLDYYPGLDTPDGDIVAQYVGMSLGEERRAPVIIDNVGVGTSPFDSCKRLGFNTDGFNGAAKAPGHDSTGALSFINLRAYAWWSLREELDPVKGSGLMLPPDDALKADLCTPKYKHVPRGIQIEGKEDIRKRLGRSPDRGDAVVMAAYIPPQGTVAISNGAPSKPDTNDYWSQIIT